MMVRIGILCVTLLLVGAPAYAQHDEPDDATEGAQDWTTPSTYQTLWLMSGSDSLIRTQQKHLRQVLAQSGGGRHLVGEQDLVQQIRDVGLQLPKCVDGTATCDSTREAAIQALRLQRLVHLQLPEKGIVEADVFDDRGRILQHIQTEKSTTRAAVMDLVSQITGASGSMHIETVPDGATVTINGEEVGQTPFQQTMKVGTYDVIVSRPGYGTERRVIDIPPEGSIRKILQLEARQAKLFLFSATPNATVRIDNQTERLPIDQPILVDAGTHQITVEADGYEPISRTFDFSAGQKRELNATLALSMKAITRQHKARIEQRPVLLQAGLRYMHNSTDWQKASVRTDDMTIFCTTRRDSPLCSASSLHAIGLDIGLLYTWKWLELQALGLSFYSLQQANHDLAVRLEGQPNATHERIGGSRTVVRIAHVGGRVLLNDVFEPYLRVGFSFAADRIQTQTTDGTDRMYAFKRASVLAELRGGLRVHINELLYGYGDVGVAADLIKRGTTTPAFEVGVGVGVNLASPFQKKKQTPSDGAPLDETVPEEI